MPQFVIIIGQTSPRGQLTISTKLAISNYNLEAENNEATSKDNAKK